MAGLRVEEAPPAPIKHSINLSIVKISHAWEEKKRSLETSWDVRRRGCRTHGNGCSEGVKITGNVQRGFFGPDRWLSSVAQL